MRALRLAVGLFSVLPVDVGDPDRRTVRWAVLLSPLVGALLGLVAASMVFALREVLEWRFGPGQPPTLGPLLAATIGILAFEVVTGGLHMDGLADSVDGLAARADRDRTLAVMRDSAVGAMGALGIAVVLAVDIVGLSIAIEHGRGTEALVTAAVAGKVAIVWGATRRAARPDGLGAWVSQVVTWRAAFVVTLLALAVPVLLLAFDDDPFGPLPSVAALPVGVVVALLVWMPLVRRVGGMTGDILGALAQTASAVTLVVTAVLG